MGYNVNMSGEFKIKHENLDEALDRLKDLNRSTPDSAKRGGSYSGGTQNASWFSWMPESFEQYEGAEEVLRDMGFECRYEGTDLVAEFYDSKTGQEDLMIGYIADLIEPGMVEWYGEDGARWAWFFDGTNLTIKEAKVTYE